MDRRCRALEHTADRDIDQIRDQILAEVRAFTTAEADDMTVVVFRYR